MDRTPIRRKNQHHDPLLGTMVGRYRVERKIGQGGTGAVYSILQPAIHKRLALKLLHEEFVNRPTMVRRFFGEAKAVNMIDHPSIVDIHDFGFLTNGRPFIIMEFLRGQNLAMYLRDHHRLSPQEAIEILRQLTSAIAAAHANHIIHRDLKPENIFILNQPETGVHIKVLDFGAAKLRDPTQKSIDSTKTGIVLGTPTYMSPEQAAGDSAHADPRTDVYSLGAILFHMLTGEPPFRGQSRAELIIKHIESEVPKVRLHSNHEAHGWSQVVATALAKNPGERFQSAHELFVAARQVAEKRQAATLPDLVRNKDHSTRPRTSRPAKMTATATSSPNGLSTTCKSLGVAAVSALVAVLITVRVRSNQSTVSRAAVSPKATKKKPDGHFPVLETARAVAATTIFNMASHLKNTETNSELTSPKISAKRISAIGTLQVRSTPWAIVSLDGKRVGTTPLNLTIASGRHRLRLYNDVLDRVQHYRFKLNSGDTHIVKKDW